MNKSLWRLAGGLVSFFFVISLGLMAASCSKAEKKEEEKTETGTESTDEGGSGSSDEEESTSSGSGESTSSSGTDTTSTGTETPAPEPTLTLSSNDIPSGSAIAQVHASTFCGGSNRSPDLNWSGISSKALSLAVTAQDLDASNFIHWIVYNIPVGSTGIASGSGFKAPAVEGPNDYGSGQTGYGGPCPPGGSTHRYEFKVWALEVADLTTVPGFDANSGSAIRTAIDARDIATASFTANYTASSQQGSGQGTGGQGTGTPPAP